METLFLTLIGITALFFLFLAIKNIFNFKKLCAVCSSVFLAWLFLLILFYLGWLENQIAISILLGMSITGIYYLVEKNVDKKLTIFRLPFILTLIAFGYFIITSSFSFSPFILIFVLWLIFFLLYLLGKYPLLKSFANKLMECCRKW